MIPAIALQAILATASGPPKPPVYRVEAYLDRAPKDADVIDQVRIGRAGRSRLLIIVGLRAANTDLSARPFRESAPGTVVVRLSGRAEEIAKLMQAEAGQKVTGIFTYRPGTQTLLVQQVER